MLKSNATACSFHRATEVRANISRLVYRELQNSTGFLGVAKLWLLFGLVVLFPIVLSSPIIRAQSPYLPHSPILIAGNSGFTATSGVTSGSGTALDPYVIEGWDINASTANGIQISNTNAYFIIRGVYIHSGMTSGHEGIVLSHLTNGQIQDSLSTQNYEGIWLNHSIGVQVSNNQLFLNSIGANFGGAALSLTSTNNTVIANNNITDNSRGAILVYGSKNVNITDNIASEARGIASIGIWISASTGIIIVNNTISHNSHIGLLLDSSTRVHVYHNNFLANSPSAQEGGGSGNSWDNGYPSGGNYWDDYWLYFQTEDNCSGPNQNVCAGPDGIGDTPYVLQTGQQDHYPLVVHDGAVLSIQAPKSVLRGKTALVNVTAENLGSVAEKAFTVTLSYGNTQIGSQTTELAPNRIVLVNFSWSTGVLGNGIQPGVYTLNASVAVPLDKSPSDNSESSTAQVLDSPTTPLASLGAVGPTLTIISELVGVGIIVIFLVSQLVGKWKRTRTKPAPFRETRAPAAYKVNLG